MMIMKYSISIQYHTVSFYISSISIYHLFISVFTNHLYPPSIPIISIYHKYNLPIRIGLSCYFNDVSNSDEVYNFVIISSNSKNK